MFPFSSPLGVFLYFTVREAVNRSITKHIDERGLHTCVIEDSFVMLPSFEWRVKYWYTLDMILFNCKIPLLMKNDLRTNPVWWTLSFSEQHTLTQLFWLEFAWHKDRGHDIPIPLLLLQLPAIRGSPAFQLFSVDVNCNAVMLQFRKPWHFLCLGAEAAVVGDDCMSSGDSHVCVCVCLTANGDFLFFYWNFLSSCDRPFVQFPAFLTKFKPTGLLKLIV